MTRRNTKKEQRVIIENTRKGYLRKVYCFNRSHNQDKFFTIQPCSIFTKDNPVPHYREGDFYDWEYCFYTMRKPRFKFRQV